MERFIKPIQDLILYFPNFKFLLERSWFYFRYEISIRMITYMIRLINTKIERTCSFVCYVLLVFRTIKKANDFLFFFPYIISLLAGLIFASVFQRPVPRMVYFFSNCFRVTVSRIFT